MSAVEASRRQMCVAKNSRLRNLTAAVALAAVLTAGCLRQGSLSEGDTALNHPYVRAVTMERDQRAEPEAFARKAGITFEEFRTRHSASGLIRCGQATGSGQLTLASNVITTAAHVFIAPGGKLRSARCTFEPTATPGVAIPIDLSSIVTGSSDPMQERATLDWAVARLADVLESARPYAIGEQPEEPSPVMLYGGGNGQAGTTGVERCSTRRVTAKAPEGVRELSFDCSAAPGGSGAALLNDKNEVVAIFVGFRSVDASRAQPFSDSHYNFAITIEGPFRHALLKMAVDDISTATASASRPAR
jgi:hypothetical protein